MGWDIYSVGSLKELDQLLRLVLSKRPNRVGFEVLNNRTFSLLSRPWSGSHPSFLLSGYCRQSVQGSNSWLTSFHCTSLRTNRTTTIPPLHGVVFNCFMTTLKKSHCIIQERLCTVFQKRALQLRKLVWIYSEDFYSVLNWYNVAKYIEFYVR
jgi:hypothetical protein